jgi:hypothetical protein
MFDWIRRENRFVYIGDGFPYHDPDNGHFYRKRADADKVCDPETERLFDGVKYEHYMVRNKIFLNNYYLKLRHKKVALWSLGQNIFYFFQQSQSILFFSKA